jgi:anti-anti-sigma factor
MGFVPPFASPFTSRTESRNGVARISLSGELDLATAPGLDDQIALAEAPGITGIMLDLRNLTFVDGAGLRSFLAARDRADANGHRLVLVGASPSARRLFRLTGTQFLLDAQEAAGVRNLFTGWNDFVPAADGVAGA